VVQGTPVLDLDYVEDSAAAVDMNIVRNDAGEYIELQGTAETTPFDRKQLDRMLELGDMGIDALSQKQSELLGPALDKLRIG
ncbi:MAG: ribonuclease PH, partial [Acidobacteriota bacterium]|nr:ribonuclease PH [Acidobacteriota bacterium]